MQTVPGNTAFQQFQVIAELASGSSRQRESWTIHRGAVAERLPDYAAWLVCLVR